MIIDTQGVVFACVSAPLLIALSLGCEHTIAAPVKDTLSPSYTELESGVVVEQVQLRPADGSQATMWGELTLFGGVEHPPNPICEHGVIDATIAVCGVIHNPDLQSLGTGELTLTFSRTGGQVLLHFGHPPNPICPTYQVLAASSVPLPEQNPGPPTIEASFNTNVGLIVGTQQNPGPPAVNPGPPTDTEGNTGLPTSWTQPGPPDCQIRFEGS